MVVLCGYNGKQRCQHVDETFIVALSGGEKSKERGSKEEGGLMVLMLQKDIRRSTSEASDSDRLEQIVVIFKGRVQLVDRVVCSRQTHMMNER